jgi:hypothetical protein
VIDNKIAKCVMRKTDLITSLRQYKRSKPNHLKLFMGIILITNYYNIVIIINNKPALFLQIKHILICECHVSKKGLKIKNQTKFQHLLSILPSIENM